MVKPLILLISLIFSVGSQAADLSLKLGRTFMFDGVNCHSASMQAAGIILYPSYVTDKEMQFIFRTQCTEVPTNRARAIGITGMGSFFSHSFFYLTPNKIFQKRSLEKKTTYEVLRAGPSPHAKYFVCHAEPVDCSDPRVSDLKVMTEKIGRYYAGMLLSAEGTKQRDVQQKNLVQLQKVTASMRGLPNECRRAVERLQLRQDSLRAVADRLSGASYFINMIPRSVGRD